MNVSFCWAANTGVSTCRSPLENVTNEFVFTFPAVPCMSFSSYLDGLWNGKSDYTTSILLGAASRNFSKQRVASLFSSYLAFSSSVLLKLL